MVLKLVRPSSYSKFPLSEKTEQGDTVSGKKAKRRNKDNTSELPYLPPVDTWAHRPLFVRPHPEPCGGTLDVSVKSIEEKTVKEVTPNISCPVGAPFEFESDLFKGRVLFRVRGLETSANLDQDKEYFEGKNRYNQFIIQGRFKEKGIRINDVSYGGEFKRRLKLAPPAFVQKMITAVFDRINPGVQFRLNAPEPSVLVNLAASVQNIRADVPGEEPDITSLEIEEFNDNFGGGSEDDKTGSWPKDRKERKRMFANFKKSSEMTFDTDLVYTFDHYDDFMDYCDYTMDLGVKKFEMSRILNNESFQIMAKSLSDGRHLWSFQLWHENFLS